MSARHSLISLAFGTLLTLVACVKEAPDADLVPPLLGFGDQAGLVDVTDDTLSVAVYLTRALRTDGQLTFELTGEDGGATDLEALTPSPVVIPAGASEVYIKIRVKQELTPGGRDRKGLLILAEGEDYRLSARSQYRISYGLRNTVDLSIWAPSTPFPQIWGYTSFGEEPVPTTGRGPSAGEHFAFAYASDTEVNVLGMFNQTDGLGTNALNMVRLYEDVSNNSSDLRIPSLFRFIPDAAGAKTGRVEVVEQRVTIKRTASSGLPPFTVGISGEGTYNETTGIISVGVVFDESELGRPEPILRRYSYESERR